MQEADSPKAHTFHLVKHGLVLTRFTCDIGHQLMELLAQLLQLAWSSARHVRSSITLNLSGLWDVLLVCCVFASYYMAQQ